MKRMDSSLLCALSAKEKKEDDPRNLPTEETSEDDTNEFYVKDNEVLVCISYVYYHTTFFDSITFNEEPLRHVRHRGFVGRSG